MKRTMLFETKASGAGQTAPLFKTGQADNIRTDRRKKLRRAACLTVMSCLILFHSAFVCSAQGASAGDAKADEAYAADFILKDLNGKDVKLSDYKGRPIFLIFMTTWCRDCFASIPTLKAIYNRYHEKGLVMLSIDIQETHAKVAAYSKKHSLPYPVLLDPEGSLSRKYGVGGVPVKALIDRSGRIICWNCRSLEELLEKQFEPAFK